MRFITVLAALLFALTVSTPPTLAQGRGNGQAKKIAAGSSAPKAKTGGPKTSAGKGNAKATTAKATPDVKHAAKAESHAAKKAAKAPTTTVATTTTTVVTPTTPTTTSVKNPKLEARLLAMLPAGMTVADAAQGFKNWGNFVAATHVSNNLGLPFDQLKSLMTGIPIPVAGTTPGTTLPVTPTGPMSLGQAIQTLKGTVVPPPTTPGTPPPQTTRPSPPPPPTTRPTPPSTPGTTPPPTTRPTPPTPPTTRAATSPTSAPLSAERIKAEVKKAEDAARADLLRTRETS